MPLLDRALSWYAAARGMLAPDAAAGGAPASLLPKISLADLKKALVPARKSALVDPALETQRLATHHAEPSVRTYLRWTPSDLTAALHQADAGNLRMAADLCEAILGDDRAVAVLNTRVNAVLGSELSFEAGRGRARATGRAVKALEAGEDWYAAWSEAVLGQMLLWGRLLGVQPAQHLWAELEDHGGRLIPVVEPWHARHLRKGPGNAWRIQVGETLEEVPAHPGDGKWIIFTPYGSSRPWAHGLWRGFARLWLLKQFAIDDWGRHSEAHGNPMKVGIPPKAGDGARHGNKALRQELAQDLAELGANSTLVLPPGFDFKLVEATANTWEMFKAQIDMANSAMSIMAIGTNLPTEVGNAAATGATAQNLVRIDYKRADAEALSTMAHDQNLVWWAQFNFGGRGLAPWPLWDVTPPADHKAKAEVLKTVADGLKAFGEAGAPVDKRKVLEEYEIPAAPVDGTPAGEAAAPSEAPSTLPAIAEAHNAAHAEPHRQTTVEVLRTVWGRGASLAAKDDRDAWAMGRVAAFLHLLAAGEPEHPAYVADNDLLPEGHERAARVVALGSPDQPRDDHGRWTDGPGGSRAAGDAAGSEVSAKRTKTHEKLERAERQAAEKAEQRAAKFEERARQSEAKAAAARARAIEAQKKTDELESVARARQSDVDDAEDALDKAKAERNVTEKHRSDVREAKKARDEADKAFSAAERRSEHLDGAADELKWSAESHRERASEAADMAKARREHAEMMAAPTDQYAKAVAKRRDLAKSELVEATKRKERFDEELSRLYDERSAAMEQARELVYHKDPAIRSSPATEAALAREKAADERWEAAFDRTDSVSHAVERASRMEGYWRDAARRAEAAVHDGPIDGDGDGKVNEDEDDDD
ncbi:phage portal protein family protein [Sorangium sp. So ce1024]|uniref:phage portal protein family protein n=1 Tax=Sorangium sp. So ce1024 TaxID=3133327 RepID=UPI003F0F58CC